MTTAEALEGLTDPGKFEVLGLRALRDLHPDCKTLIHLGMNAGGKTVRGPVDAFTLLPESCPPKYVYATFTLAGRRELVRKWLHDPTSQRAAPSKSEAGDLIKAAWDAARLRSETPDSEFVVYLCTNRQLDQDLMERVYAEGRLRSIHVVFLESSRLRDYLDSATGQTTREEFLGIEANQLSRELLLKVGQVSLRDYEIDGFEDDQFVPTAAWREVQTAVTSTIPLRILVGRPGAGKSVLARRLLQQQLAAGGMGLWVPGHILQHAASVPDAVRLALKQLRSHLSDDAGHDACALATPQDPLLLIFDDANKVESPGRLLNKILTWGRALFGRRENQGSAAIRIVVPVWESYWAVLHRQYEGAQWLQSQVIGPMLRAEAIDCLRSRIENCATGFTDHELNDIADRLRDDPILLAVFARLIREGAQVNITPLLEDTIGSFIRSSLQRLSLENCTLEASCRVALIELGRAMILRRSLHPSWSDLQGWFEKDSLTLSCLENIAVHGHICRVVRRGTRDIFEFRHDRILEHHLSETVVAMMESKDADLREAFDPFLGRIVGRALAVHDADDRILDDLGAMLPVSLVVALAHLPHSRSVRSDRLCQRARGWLASIDTASHSLRDDALDILANTSSPHVLDVTENTPAEPYVHFARLRNGDAIAGANALSRRYYPSTNYPWLESLISYASDRYRAEMTRSLQCLLVDPDIPPELRVGALVLAGYLGYGDLKSSIRVTWQYADRSFDSVLAAVWAALRCAADEQSGELLEAVLPGIFSVSDEKRSGGWSDRDELYQELAFSGRHGYSPAVITKLEELAVRDGQYANLVFRLFEEIDDPSALKFVITRVAKASAKPHKEGALTHAHIWETQWRRSSGFEYRPMPAASVETLEQMWAAGNPDWLRRFAFKQWIRFSGGALWTVRLPDDLSQTDEAVWERARRRDRRVGSTVLRELQTKPHWYQLVPHVWTSEFECVLDSALREGNWWAVHILRDIPEMTAERLILSNWDSIHDFAEAIHAALYVGSARTQALAAEMLSKHSDASKAMAHISGYFGFREHGRQDRLSQRHLDALRPYLAILSSYCLFHMVDFCGRHGFRDWAARELIPECRRRLAERADRLLSSAVLQWFPTDEDLVVHLDRIARDDTSRWKSDMWLWGERASERCDDLGRLTEVLRQWLTNGFSPRKFEISAAAVRYHGNRAALAMLKSVVQFDTAERLADCLRDAEYGVKRRSFS